MFNWEPNAALRRILASGGIAVVVHAARRNMLMGKLTAPYARRIHLHIRKHFPAWVSCGRFGAAFLLGVSSAIVCNEHFGMKSS